MKKTKKKCHGGRARARSKFNAHFFFESEREREREERESKREHCERARARLDRSENPTTRDKEVVKEVVVTVDQLVEVALKGAHDLSDQTNWIKPEMPARIDLK